MYMHRTLHVVAFILLVVGGLNWGLLGAFDFNLVTTLVGMVGEYPLVIKGIYIAVGVAAVYEALCCRGRFGACASK